MIKCENCDIPKGASLNPGVDQTLAFKSENNFKRERKLTIWNCNETCALQSRARAKYGESSHKWPVTLAQFAADEKFDGNRKSDRKCHL